MTPPVDRTTSEPRLADSVVVEEARAFFMRVHSREWTMDTISEIAHLVGELVALTGTGDVPKVLRAMNRALPLTSEQLTRRAVLALREALDV